MSTSKALYLHGYPFLMLPSFLRTVLFPCPAPRHSTFQLPQQFEHGVSIFLSLPMIWVATFQISFQRWNTLSFTGKLLSRVPTDPGRGYSCSLPLTDAELLHDIVLGWSGPDLPVAKAWICAMVRLARPTGFPKAPQLLMNCCLASVGFMIQKYNLFWTFLLKIISIKKQGIKPAL